MRAASARRIAVADDIVHSNSAAGPDLATLTRHDTVGAQSGPQGADAMTVELLSALEAYLKKGDQEHQHLLVARLRANGLRIPAEQAPAGTRVEVDMPTLTRLIQGVMDHVPGAADVMARPKESATVVPMPGPERPRPSLMVVAAERAPTAAVGPILRRLAGDDPIAEAIAASEAAFRQIKDVYARTDLDERAKNRMANALRSENLARYPLHPDLEVDIWTDRFAF